MEKGVKNYISEATKEIRRGIEDKSLDFIIKTYAKDFKEKGWKTIPESMAHYLETLGVRPDYLIFNNKEAANQLRHKLETESGLVISNHPVGFIDVPIVLKTINRPDFKAFVGDRIYQAMVNSFEQHFGEEGKVFAESKLLSNKAKSARTNFYNALKHIEEGGVVIMHPTMGFDRGLGEDAEFGRGFRLFLEKLNPNKMIYTFCVSPKDLREHFPDRIETAKRFIGLSSEELLYKNININDKRAPANIRVDEKYTQVKDWLSDKKATGDSELKGYYWNLFSKDIR